MFGMGMAGLSRLFAPQGGAGGAPPAGGMPQWAGPMGGLGAQLMQMGGPRFAGQAGPPQQVPGMGNLGLLGGMRPPQQPQQMPQMDPRIMGLLQQHLGPTSQAGWDLGTTTTPTPSRFASPQNLFASLFNRGGYQ